MLIPGFSFGVSQLYQVSHGTLGKFFERLSRKLKTSLVLFSGRWGTPLPYPHEMACAFGTPIDMRTVPDGKTGHDLYIKHLREAFEHYKADFGWGARQLYFLGEDLPVRPQDDLEEYTALPSSTSL